MSIVYCSYCDKNIDTDFDVEHFTDENMEHCIKEEEDLATKETCGYCKWWMLIFSSAHSGRCKKEKNDKGWTVMSTDDTCKYFEIKATKKCQ